MEEFENEFKPENEIPEAELNVETDEIVVDDTTKADEVSESEKKKLDIKKEIKDWVVSIAIAVIVALVIRTYIFTLVRVDGQSMEPTLSHGDVLYTNRFMYEPQNGDIVIFRPTHSPETPYVKRVIAVAGQTVTVNAEAHTVVVDGRILPEDYIKEPLLSAGTMKYPVTVPDGYIFVLGDNRNNSRDSRDVTVGLVPVESIIGKALFRILPVSEIGGLY